MTPELNELCVAAAQAVGGGVLAVDILEDPQRGYLVNEVNHTMEFHTLAPVTGVDIPGIMVDYTLALAHGQVQAPTRRIPFPLPAFSPQPQLVPVQCQSRVRYDTYLIPACADHQSPAQTISIMRNLILDIHSRYPIIFYNGLQI